MAKKKSTGILKELVTRTNKARDWTALFADNKLSSAREISDLLSMVEMLVEAIADLEIKSVICGRIRDIITSLRKELIKQQDAAIFFNNNKGKIIELYRELNRLAQAIEKAFGK